MLIIPVSKSKVDFKLISYEVYYLCPLVIVFKFNFRTSYKCEKYKIAHNSF